MTKAHGITPDQLKSYIERIEKLEEEKAALQADIKEVKAEAKANGFQPNIINEVLRLRKMDEQQRQEHQSLLELYQSALGME